MYKSVILGILDVFGKGFQHPGDGGGEGSDLYDPFSYGVRKN